MWRQSMNTKWIAPLTEYLVAIESEARKKRVNCAGDISPQPCVKFSCLMLPRP